jgi:hypothetical protein
MTLLESPHPALLLLLGVAIWDSGFISSLFNVCIGFSVNMFLSESVREPRPEAGGGRGVGRGLWCIFGY